ncbi:YceI family protein [Micromonospora sp. CPCC 205371]|nr:YceI family protein [Micromonospora sp. CPCC 205371]
MTIDSTTTRPAIAAGRYTIDPSGTTVRFAVKEMWGLVTVRGTIGVTGGAIVVADDPAASSVRVALDPASFASGNKRRDKDVTGKNFLDAAAYPEMGFTSTRVAYGRDGWTMTGMLTTHGVTAPVTLRLVEGRATPDGCAFTATAVVDRTAHGVSKAAGFIAREVTVTIDVTARSV